MESTVPNVVQMYNTVFSETLPLARRTGVPAKFFETITKYHSKLIKIVRQF